MIKHIEGYVKTAAFLHSLMDSSVSGLYSDFFLLFLLFLDLLLPNENEGFLPFLKKKM